MTGSQIHCTRPDIGGGIHGLCYAYLVNGRCPKHGDDEPDQGQEAANEEHRREERRKLEQLDILSGADDGDQTADMLRLAAEYLDDSGFGGPLAGKLRAKATRIEDVLSNARLDRPEGAKETP
jgi:hypothetical protein